MFSIPCMDFGNVSVGKSDLSSVIMTYEYARKS